MEWPTQEFGRTVFEIYHRPAERACSAPALTILIYLLGLVLALPAVSQPTPEGVAALQQMNKRGRLGIAIIDALVGNDSETDITEPRVNVIVAFRIPDINGQEARLTERSGRAALARTANRLLSTTTPQNFEITTRWRSIPGMAGRITAQGVLDLLFQPDVLRIDMDPGGGGGLAQSVPQVNLDQVRTNLGLTGIGIRIAVLDSGIDSDHPDIADALIGQRCFAEGGLACPGGALSAEDDFGHGTSVSGVITSNGNVAPIGGAPDAEIFAIKVLDNNNRFSASAFVIDALDFVISDLPDIDLVNMSLGTDEQFTGVCDGATSSTLLFASAIDTLRDRGALTTISAGNQAQTNSMGSPACISSAIAVGSVYDTTTTPGDFIGVCTDNIAPADEPACYSNASSATDIFAPGSRITTSSLGGGSVSVDGTSFAAPLVAACIAAIRQAVPDLSTAEIETLIKANTNVFVNRGGRTFPRLDCLDAVLAANGGGLNTPPDVAIDSPSDGSIFEAGIPVTLTGTATDTEDGDISNLINWSDNGVNFDIGASVSRVFSPASHDITATITDSGGLGNSATITVAAQDSQSPGDCLFNAVFESGPDGFNFIEDPENPEVTLGSINADNLSVSVGDVNNSDIFDMAGAWKRNCINDVTRLVTVTARAALTQSSDYEADESSELRLRVNNSPTLLARITGNGNGGNAQSTGLQTFTIQATLPEGVSTIEFECFNNKKTFANEVTTCTIDSVSVSESALSGDCLFNANFDDDTDSFSFVPDPQDPSFTSGSSSAGSLRSSVGGVNNSNIVDMLGSWERSCASSETRMVSVTVTSNLTQASNYESDEFSEARLRVNGNATVLARITGNGNGGSASSTGLQTTAIQATLAEGTNTITLECFNNKKTFADEVTTCDFDNLFIQ